MSKRAPRRSAATVVATLVTFSLGATLAVLVAGSASAAGSQGTTTTTTDSPTAHFFVVNGTVNAASDHEIVGSSAFPNFTTGAVDNYYSMAHSHVDNSPFAEGRASPADTGPVGQTAAAGNFQQPQYADARWPGDPPTATYGSQGGPYATATAAKYHATAEASEASNGLSGPGPTGAPTLAVPAGFDARLRQALAEWKATLPDGAAPAKPAPAVTTPIATVAPPKATAPPSTVTTPTPTVTTAVATVTAPTAAPSVTVPTPTLPSAPRSLQAAAKPDGEALLTSSTLAMLDSQTNTLVTSGESSLGRVSLGGGQIVIEGIHVTASITNDGNPEYKAAVSIGSATIGGVPVTIDQDGVHVSGQGQGLPYQQASDALNGALKQAGIRLFLVAPEVTAPCGQAAGGSGSGSSSGATTTTSSDQSGATSSCGQGGATGTCDSPGAGGGTEPRLPSVAPSSTTTTTSGAQTSTTTTPSSCAETGATASCDQPGTGGGTSTTTTTSKNTTTTSGCEQTGTSPTTSSCSTAGTPGTATTSTNKTDTTAAPSPIDPMGPGAGATNASEETVRATGVHVVFTQPVNQPGVPAQYVEHILGEVFVDSLAAPAGDAPKLDLSSSSFSTSSSPSTCGRHSSKTASRGGSSARGSSSAGAGPSAGEATAGGGSIASGSPAAAGSSFGSGSQPSSGSGSGGNSLPAAFAAALRKPLWLLLAYLVWQALVVATGASLWNWRRDEAS